ncbi:unnamed protein product [Schistosoma margrebowiei]|uniref:Uncharacterized protein n=1 Tax=Schistosoma margrebowiei TaxID=48269 RepID=A0A183MJ09_9TREM|nr:unnamed protein product [Schistosoma margrebowiei]
MKTSTSKMNHEIRWTARNRLDDLNFVYDLALLSHTYQQMQMKTTSVAAASVSVRLNMNMDKTNIIKYNTENTNNITLDEETLEEVKTSTYLDSIVDGQGGSDAEVKLRIGKVRAPSLQLNHIWNSNQLSVNQHQSHYLQYERQDSSVLRI